MTGEGEMLKQEEKDNFELTNIKSINYKLVLMYNFNVVGVYNDEVDCNPYIVDHIVFQDAKEGGICMPVSDRSMLPTLKEVRRNEEDRINNFLLMSHNAEFEPTEIAKDFIVEVYLVNAMCHNLTI